MEVTARGGRAVVRLPVHGTTGHEWVLESLPESLRLVDEHYVQEGVPGDRMVGAGGVHVFTVEVPEAGSYELTFALRRPWESQALETRTVHIRRTDD